ncbi:sigma-54-dependent transcriptional regulator [Candidatus Sumerlaeota bacterium]
MAVSIFIIDDEVKMGSILKRALSREGWRVEAFTDPTQPLELFTQAAQAPPADDGPPADIVLCDLKMPQMGGLEVLERIKALVPTTEFIMMTAFASVETAVEAMKQGAFDYLIKPFATDELKILIRRIIETRDLRAENVRLRELVEQPFELQDVVAASGAMREVLERARKVARSDATVLLRGESGVGKDVTAKAIVLNSARRDATFLKINCGALPESLLESELFGHVRGAFTGAAEDRAGLFETCDAGTLLLDEIGEVSAALQVKLLRVLQEGEFQRVGESRPRQVDVRVIAATNRDLEQMLSEGTFRQDLYYRLNVVPLLIPPLRERPEDIPALIDHFLRKQAKRAARQVKSLTPEAYDSLLAYSWPGNIRELENAIEHALVMSEGEQLGLDDLPISLRSTRPAGQAGDGSPASWGNLTLEQLEQGAIEQALGRANHNYTRAARLLGITRRTLGYRMKRLGIPGKNAPLDGDDDDDDEGGGGVAGESATDAAAAD